MFCVIFLLGSCVHNNLSCFAGALITARKQARDRMAEESISPEEHAVLDGRQKALKVQPQTILFDVNIVASLPPF